MFKKGFWVAYKGIKIYEHNINEQWGKKKKKKGRKTKEKTK